MKRGLGFGIADLPVGGDMRAINDSWVGRPIRRLAAVAP
jgi:hypothetical protein